MQLLSASCALDSPLLSTRGTPTGKQILNSGNRNSGLSHRALFVAPLPLLRMVQDISKEKLAARRWKRVAIIAMFSTALRWLPILVGVGISTATLFVWQALIDQERTQIEQMIQLESSNVNNVVAAQLKTRMNALQRMANRWEIRGGTPKREWEFDAQSDVSDDKGFQAIEWADPSFHIRWIVPLAGNEAAQNLNVAREPRRRIALEAARNRHQVTATRSISLVQGGKGFLAYVPIFQGGDFRGFIVGVFRHERLLDTILQGEENVRRGYSITVFDGSVGSHSGKRSASSLSS